MISSFSEDLLGDNDVLSSQYCCVLEDAELKRQGSACVVDPVIGVANEWSSEVVHEENDKELGKKPEKNRFLNWRMADECSGLGLERHG